MGQICKPILDADNASLEFELVNTTLGKQHYWRTFFPLKEVSRFTVKTIEGNEGLPVAARRVAFNSKNPLFSRKDLGQRELKLGKYAASRDKDEIQIQEYRDLQAIAASSKNPAVARELVEMTYDDVKFCEAAIPAKIEIDALGIASLGKQTFPVSKEGDMVTADEIDFGVPSANFGGVTTAWTNTANADGIADLVAMQEAVAATGYGKPRYAIMEDSKYKQLIAQDKVAKRLFPFAKAINALPIGAVNLEEINKYMDANGYPHILVIDSWVANEKLDGSITNVKPWNANVVTLSLTPQLGYTYWKRKHIEDAEDKVSIEAAGEFYNVTIEGERNPDKVTTSAEAYAQCGLINRHSLCFINTTNASWNNGE